jgi:FkbM family methyltransferase
MAAASSRPGFRDVCFALLRPFIHSGEITIQYTCEGRLYSAFIRVDDVFSDFFTFHELVVKGIYKIDSRFAPDLVVDCGGNTGLFSLEASARYPSAKIVVCEPVPRNLDQIRKHLSFNSVAAEVLPVCVGGSRRMIPFYVREANSGSFEATKPYMSKFDVEVLALTDVLRDRNARAVYIKMDIEGMEIEVLESYVPSETRAVCVIGELHNHKDNSHRLERIFGDCRWQLRFVNVSDVSNADSIFEAYSPAALELLNRSPTSNASPGRSPLGQKIPTTFSFHRVL